MGGGTEHPLARRITDGLEPRAWTVAVALLTGWHAEGAAGVGWGAFAAFLASATGPWVLAGYVLALVGRSRVRLRDHTPAQATAGTALGAAVAGPVFLGLVRRRG
ncbi:hypothetical protein SLAV_06085 [Streptomyces lavendulae subsp. lavendulae]|uniref:Uncharacterized protein n=1 Tax=Streptomyces lavendulae subsp. lavendulae TaxID=58340 RepID=A0A2K8P8Q3_STRLA|nr:hypothetical protein [Streptomyces lavendulae]ATZ23122.1 hypothetical protein SLAV_06085 [Streptomyces lavendulae subsp. lavendulae]QUQ52959.1 hypothetical protein SLLC_04110 [Streptomyces lavendulae subsp. lavendulae]